MDGDPVGFDDALRCRAFFDPFGSSAPGCSGASLATLTLNLAFAVPPGPEASIVMRVSKPSERGLRPSASCTCRCASDPLPEQATARLCPSVSPGEETKHRLAPLTTALIVSTRCPLLPCETVYRNPAIDGLVWAALATHGATQLPTASNATSHAASSSAMAARRDLILLSRSLETREREYSLQMKGMIARAWDEPRGWDEPAAAAVGAGDSLCIDERRTAPNRCVAGRARRGCGPYVWRLRGGSCEQ